MDVTVADPLVGRELDGRYVVRSRIARGGMATVYLALDQRLDREVALKVMHPNLVDDEAFVSRFTREARSAARLNHPGIVQVFDQGSHDGVVFLAMEHVPGRTLRDVMRDRGPMTAHEALDLLEPVLDALGAAHSAGIVHRDIKPENVLIRDDGRVKVADFGLARAVGASTAHSQTGLLIGTVSYLAPEQVERGSADARSDVYATGVVLFEMLTGTKPFGGDTPVQIALQHVSSRVPAPSSRAAGIHPALDDLVLLATARDPAERPADARDLLMALRETRRVLPAPALDARPVTVVPEPHQPPADTPAERTMALDAVTAPAAAPARGHRRRSRGRIALAVVLGLALLLGVGGWYVGAGPGAYVRVPTVVGLTQAEATAALTKRGLDAETSPGFSETVAAGSVVSADPGEGARARKGSAVQLVISRGPERYGVPKLAGLTEDAARAAIATAHLVVGKVSRRFDDSVPDGSVVSASLQAGTKVRRDTAVDLVISRGREPVAVGDWVGKPADQATQALEGSGLKVTTTEAFDDQVPKGSVVSQDPGPGSAFKGDTVKLVVSKGPELVPVPRVVGMSAKKARDKLEAAGFKVNVTSVFGNGGGTVIAQRPGAGSKVKPGSTVTIAVL
ncbi:MAG: Stk1 family PASTA domain-containing Ser/Thr kinase [Angustibacter sp.]